MALSQFLYDNRCDRADCDGLDGIIQYAPGACEEPCLYRPRAYRVLLRVCRAAQPGHHHAVLGVPRGHTRDGSLLASCMSQLPARLFMQARALLFDVCLSVLEFTAQSRPLLVVMYGRARSRTLGSVLCVAFQMAESAVLLSPVPIASTKPGAPASATEPWDVMTAASATTPPTASPAAVAPTPRWAIVVVMLCAREVGSVLAGTCVFENCRGDTCTLVAL